MTNLLNTTTVNTTPCYNVIVLTDGAVVGTDLRAALSNYCQLWQESAWEIQITGEVSDELEYGIEWTVYVIEQLVPRNELHVQDGFLSWDGGYLYCSL